MRGTYEVLSSIMLNKGEGMKFRQEPGQRKLIDHTIEYISLSPADMFCLHGGAN